MSTCLQIALNMRFCFGALTWSLFDLDLKYARVRSGCSRAALPLSVGKGLADRAVAGLCVYWCSIERASVREFMLVVATRWF